MATIAELAVSVRADGAKQTERELAALEKQAAKTEQRAATMGKAWGVAFGGAAAAVFIGGAKAIIQNTIEAERVQSRLEGRIRALGSTSAASAVQIELMAGRLQMLSTFDDEKIKEAATTLLSFNNIRGDNFERTLRAVTDLAADSGDDLVATAEKVGRALNNPATASRTLRDVGIELSKQQKALVNDLLATGKGSEAQAMLLRELEKRYAGAAEAARNTLGGALQGLKNDFANLLEGDGNGLRGATEAINDLAATMRSPAVREGFQAITSGLFEVVRVAAQAVGAVSDFSDEIKKLSGLNLGGAASVLFNVATGNAAGVVRAFADANRADFTGAVGGSGSTEGGRADHFDGRGFEGGSSGSKRKRGRKLPDFARDAADELRKLLDTESDAREQFNSLAATLAGPLAEATYQFGQDQKQLNELARTGAIDAGTLATAQANLRAQYEADTKAIQARLDPGKQLLDDLQFELSLMKMGAVERATAIQLRGADAEAVRKYGAAVADANRQILDSQRTIDAMDSFRDIASDFLVDLPTKGKGAWRDFLDDLSAQLRRWAANGLIEQLFGARGTNGQGTTGGGWAGALLGAFGGSSGGGNANAWADLFGFASDGFGFADGGYTGPGGRNKVAGVVHAGEYVLSAAATARIGRGALDSMNTGGQGPSSGNTVQQTFVIQGALDNTTREQLARRSGREVETAMRRA